ncbi:Putative serine esterase (DUF676) [Musa troglodytarum]|uniref:Serine esterase (DUF676) n=1 Tax=Musa troglodytarum TaxID=320322 RepID=A0A9E7G2Y7_9LILI|nr:Putative serine esterase (DUF676) [Musa troglodytarum]
MEGGRARTWRAVSARKRSEVMRRPSRKPRSMNSSRIQRWTASSWSPSMISRAWRLQNLALYVYEHNKFIEVGETTDSICKL